MPAVVLIGGGASVGKSTLARELAGRYGADHLQIDDLRAGLDDPRLAAPDWGLAPGRLTAQLRDAADALQPVVGAVVEEALAGDARLVLEGEQLHPAVAAAHRDDPRVAAVFLLEHEPDRIAQVLRGRLTAAERATAARTYALYSTWLERECSALGLAAVSAQPWTTLADRADAALSGSAPRGSGRAATRGPAPAPDRRSAGSS